MRTFAIDSGNAICRPLRILHVLPSLDPSTGGTAKAGADILNGLARRGHSVTAITFSPAPAIELSLDPNVSRHFLPSRGRLFGFDKTTRGFFRHITGSFDIVHFHGMWEVECIQLANDVSQADVPYVVTPHGMLDRWSLSQNSIRKRLFLAAAGSRYLAKSSTVHFTASEEAVQAGAVIALQRCAVVPLPVEPPLLPDERLIERRSAQSRKPAILFMSRLHPKKGLEYLIRGVHQIWADGIDVDLHVAGTGEATYVDTLTNLAGSSSRKGCSICFHGMVVGEKKSNLLASSSIFALPTYQENFGIALVEAMYAGLPVATTRGVDIWSDLSESGALALCKQDARSVASAIMTLWLKIQSRELTGEGIAAWARRRFMPDAVLPQYESMYAACLGSRSCAP